MILDGKVVAQKVLDDVRAGVARLEARSGVEQNGNKLKTRAAVPRNNLVQYGLAMAGIATGSGSFTQFAPGVTVFAAAIAAAAVLTVGLGLGSGSSLMSLRRHMES